MSHRLFTLYINYLLGKYSREEFLEMKTLLADTDDEALETLMNKAWEKELPTPSMPEVTKRRVKSNILLATSLNEKKQNVSTKWWSVAAVILLFIIAGSTYIYVGKQADRYKSPFIVSIEKGQKASINLPDQSIVRLNAETTLEYDLKNTKQRKVYLNGEAFFKVVKDEKRPFIVDMDELQIEVLGTSFNVQTYQNEECIYASLVEGSIKLTGKRFSESYQLEPMQQLIYDKKDATLKIVELDSDTELGWMSDRLVFNSEPLYKILQRIERWYDITIDLQCPEIKDDRMSGTFYKEELHTVLEAIHIQYKISYTVKEGHVIITKR